VDFSDIHSRLLSIEEKLTAIMEENTRIRVEGFERITRMETQLKQVMENDLPHLHADVTALKRTLSPRNFLLYVGGISTLVVTLLNLARIVHLIP
jgi:hypothetical protein